MKRLYIYNIDTDGGGGILKFVMLLRILLFSNNISIVHFVDGAGGRRDHRFIGLVIFWKSHKCMVP